MYSLIRKCSGCFLLASICALPTVLPAQRAAVGGESPTRVSDIREEIPLSGRNPLQRREDPPQRGEDPPQRGEDPLPRDEADPLVTVFLRGDANADGAVDMSDSLSILNCQFAGSICSDCDDAADVNDDNTVDLSDAMSGLNFLFRGSAPPPLPYPECGVDLTRGSLGCAAYEVCPSAGSGGPLRIASADKRLSLGMDVNVWKDLRRLFGEPELVYLRKDGSYDKKLSLMDAGGFPAGDVGYYGSRPAWQPGGAKIAFECGLDICVVNSDGSGFKKLTYDGGLTQDYHPAWSPDGKKIVFQRDQDLHVLTLDTAGNPVNIVRITTATDDNARDYEPAWSPDGSRIVFSRANNNASNFNLFFVHPDGSGLVQVTDNAHQDRDPSWHPDGNMLVFSRRIKDDSNSNLHLILFAGAFQYPMAVTSSPTEQDRRPSFSPDGSTIAFMRRAPGATWLHNVFTININGTQLKPMTFQTIDDGMHDAREPHWRW